MAFFFYCTEQLEKRKWRCSAWIVSRNTNMYVCNGFGFDRCEGGACLEKSSGNGLCDVELDSSLLRSFMIAAPNGKKDICVQALGMERS